MSNSLKPHGLQHTRLLCLPLSPIVCSDSCPMSQWCYLTISSSALPSSPFAINLFWHQSLFQWVMEFMDGLKRSVSLWVSLNLNCTGVQVLFPRAFPLLLHETLFKRTRTKRVVCAKQGQSHSSILYLLQIPLIYTVPFLSESRFSYSTKSFQLLLIYDGVLFSH